jgi:hypothetical protein
MYLYSLQIKGDSKKIINQLEIQLLKVRQEGNRKLKEDKYIKEHTRPMAYILRQEKRIEQITTNMLKHDK